MGIDEIVIVVWGVAALAACACMVIVVWIRSRSRQEQARLRAEVQKSLLEKFSSSEEMAAFLASAGSQRFLGDLSLEKRHSDVKERILRSVRAGVIFCTIGLAFLVLAVSAQERRVAVPGVFCLALGIGLLAAATVSYRLGKKWGLTNGSPDESLGNATDRISGAGGVLS